MTVIEADEDNEEFNRMYEEMIESYDEHANGGIIKGNHIEDNKEPRESGKPITTISVSDALRIMPEAFLNHSQDLRVKGIISSLRSVIKMISGEYGECPECGTYYDIKYEKPAFNVKPRSITECTKLDSIEHKISGGTISLKKGYGFRNALIVELQDEDRFNDLEKLSVILFDGDTENVLVGERVTISGKIFVEKTGTAKNTKLNSVLYADSITYETRQEVILTEMDKNAVKRFVTRFGKGTITKLTEMFAPSVIGYDHVKTGLLLSAVSTANDSRSNKKFKQRIRLHSILVGEPGLAKSVLLKEGVKIVPNGRYESGQNSSGKSLTAIVSKEFNDTCILRLGPIPLAKESICAINEIGRMTFEDQAHLLDVMEEGEFTINKHGINAHIRSPTVIIASANPTSTMWTDSEGKINLDDIPALKPILDRFDLMFAFRTSRDESVIREYAYAKSSLEDRLMPNYNSYLIKHLMYARELNRKVSDDARIMLNEYYIEAAKRIGSPRIRETLFNISRMIAKLHLKEVIDGEDAKEACQFFNVILNERDRVVNVPANPRDYTYNECLYILEYTRGPITFEELIKAACKKNEYIRLYIGEDIKIRSNTKMRSILDLLLNHSCVRRIQLKPTILEWVGRDQKEKAEESSIIVNN
jgi:replicative DNA helicase Mcm